MIQIPSPLVIVVDDVGWWSGTDGSAVNQPYRTGIFRDHVVEDYEALVDLGRALGIRILAAFVGCEWDWRHRLAHVPSSTWMGAAWKNPQMHRRADMELAAQMISKHPESISLCCHGLAHEYWNRGKMERAEWYSPIGVARPDTAEHLELFHEILRDNQLPETLDTFIPCAFQFHANDATPNGAAGLLRSFGYKAMSTVFDRMSGTHPVGQPWYQDSGLWNLDRGRDLVSWNSMNTTPDKVIDGWCCGLHWPALLHSDPFRNGQAVAAWVSYFDRFLSDGSRVMVGSIEEAIMQGCANHSIKITSLPTENTFQISNLHPPIAKAAPPVTEFVIHSSKALCMIGNTTAQLQKNLTRHVPFSYRLSAIQHIDKVILKEGK